MPQLKYQLLGITAPLTPMSNTSSNTNRAEPVVAEAVEELSPVSLLELVSQVEPLQAPAQLTLMFLALPQIPMEVPQRYLF